MSAKWQKKGNRKGFEEILKQYEEQGWHCCDLYPHAKRAIIAKGDRFLTIIRTTTLEGCHGLD